MNGKDDKYEVRAKVFSALSNPNRIRIVEALITGEKNVGEITTELKIDQSLVSHHLKTLKDCGIVFSTRNGQNRTYGLRNSQFKEILEITDVILVNIADDLTKCVCD